MTPKGQRVIKCYCDQLYDTKGHGDLYGQFDLVYDPKMSRGSLEVALTYFVTPKATVTFVVGLTPKGHMIIRGCRDLLYDPKGHGDLCGRFDLVYNLKRSQGH